ncbi:hypothetical protein AU476_30010 [Cupriavidus sp. UYMSc13B]|nr:hypothetical protein AU476_30010 [Cupriavidus sp. UYMSc13B]
MDDDFDVVFGASPVNVIVVTDDEVAGALVMCDNTAFTIRVQIGLKLDPSAFHVHIPSIG